MASCRLRPPRSLAWLVPSSRTRHLAFKGSITLSARAARNPPFTMTGNCKGEASTVQAPHERPGSARVPPVRQAKARLVASAREIRLIGWTLVRVGWSDRKSSFPRRPSRGQRFSNATARLFGAVGAVDCNAGARLVVRSLFLQTHIEGSDRPRISPCPAAQSKETPRGVVDCVGRGPPCAGLCGLDL